MKEETILSDNEELNSLSDWNVAIVLSGGRGSRMNSDIPKQYMSVCGKPLLYYSLNMMQHSFIDEIILVAAEGDIQFCKDEIVDKYNFNKVSCVVAGGKERYDSVYNGLLAISNESIKLKKNPTYVFIHDGARPFITNKILTDCYSTVKYTDACVAAMPVKDTIKVVDNSGFAVSTPNRSTLWQIQTPQVFSYELIRRAYDKMMLSETKLGVTDDAMVVEEYTESKVKLVESDYRNIKVTTIEDLDVVETLLKKCDSMDAI